MPAALQKAGLSTRMILQVHDELVFESPSAEATKAAAVARQVMESAIELSIPLRADTKVGLNWEEMQNSGGH